MNKIVVTIVDKQALFRVGVRHALSRQSEFEVFGFSPNERPLRLIEANPPDVLLLDIDYPSLEGLNLAKDISLHCPATKVIMLTYNPDDKQLLEIIKVGAVDCLDKKTTTKQLTESIRQVACGEYPINDTVLARPSLAKHLLKQFQSAHNISGKTEGTLVVSLTSRETEILNYVANGNSNKQIAHILLISEQTIKNHVSNILRKLKANDRAHAVVKAIRLGLITVEEFRPLTYIKN